MAEAVVGEELRKIKEALTIDIKALFGKLKISNKQIFKLRSAYNRITKHNELQWRSIIKLNGGVASGQRE